MLNDNDDKSKSSQFKGTYSEANASAMGEPDAPPRDPTSELIGDGFDLAS
jgi:hypothetical protein